MEIQVKKYMMEVYRECINREIEYFISNYQSNIEEKNFKSNLEYFEVIYLKAIEKIKDSWEKELKRVRKEVEDIDKLVYNYSPEIKLEGVQMPLIEFEKWEEESKKYYYREYNSCKEEMSISEIRVKTKKIIFDNFQEPILNILSQYQNKLEIYIKELIRDHELKMKIVEDELKYKYEKQIKLGKKIDRLRFLQKVIEFNFGNISEKIVVDY